MRGRRHVKTRDDGPKNQTLTDKAFEEAVDPTRLQSEVQADVNALQSIIPADVAKKVLKDTKAQEYEAVKQALPLIVQAVDSHNPDLLQHVLDEHHLSPQMTLGIQRLAAAAARNGKEFGVIIAAISSKIAPIVINLIGTLTGTLLEAIIQALIQGIGHGLTVSNFTKQLPNKMEYVQVLKNGWTSDLMVISPENAPAFLQEVDCFNNAISGMNNLEIELSVILGFSMLQISGFLATHSGIEGLISGPNSTQCIIPEFTPFMLECILSAANTMSLPAVIEDLQQVAAHIRSTIGPSEKIVLAPHTESCHFRQTRQNLGRALYDPAVRHALYHSALENVGFEVALNMKNGGIQSVRTRGGMMDALMNMMKPAKDAIGTQQKTFESNVDNAKNAAVTDNGSTFSTIVKSLAVMLKGLSKQGTNMAATGFDTVTAAVNAASIGISSVLGSDAAKEIINSVGNTAAASANQVGSAAADAVTKSLVRQIEEAAKPKEKSVSIPSSSHSTTVSKPSKPITKSLKKPSPTRDRMITDGVSEIASFPLHDRLKEGAFWVEVKEGRAPDGFDFSRLPAESVKLLMDASRAIYNYGSDLENAIRSIPILGISMPSTFRVLVPMTDLNCQLFGYAVGRDIAERVDPKISEQIVCAIKIVLDKSKGNPQMSVTEATVAALIGGESFSLNQSSVIDAGWFADHLIAHQGLPTLGWVELFSRDPQMIRILGGFLFGLASCEIPVRKILIDQ